MELEGELPIYLNEIRPNEVFLGFSGENCSDSWSKIYLHLPLYLG